MTTTARWTVACDAVGHHQDAAEPVAGVTRPEAEAAASAAGWLVLDPWNAICPHCLERRTAARGQLTQGDQS